MLSVCVKVLCFPSSSTESLKEAITRALRHSRSQGQRTYEKKQLALNYAREHATTALNEASDGEHLHCTKHCRFCRTCGGLESSTEKQPKGV